MNWNAFSSSKRGDKPNTLSLKTSNPFLMYFYRDKFILFALLASEIRLIFSGFDNFPAPSFLTAIAKTSSKSGKRTRVFLYLSAAPSQIDLGTEAGG